MTIAFLDWSLEVECPHCKEETDLVKYESEQGDYIIAEAVFNNRWDDVAGYEVICPKCQHDFELSGIEY